MSDLQEILVQGAQQRDKFLYLKHKNNAITFSEVIPALTELSSQLPPLRGLRIVVLLPDALTTALLHLLCFREGATIIPLSPFTAASNLEYILHYVCPDLILTTAILHNKFDKVLEQESIAIIDDTFPARVHFPGSRCPRDGAGRSSAVRAILFTSGTTGTPKGVCLSEGGLFSAAAINSTILGLNPSRCSLVMVPLYDYYGMIQLYSHALAKMTCVFGESGQFPKSAFQAISKQTVTDLVLVPYTLNTLLDFLDRSPAHEHHQAWKNLAFIASSSDRLPEALLSRTFLLNPALSVVNVYGLTEAGRACFHVLHQGFNSSDSIGRASPGMRVWVDAPAGKSGEIIISGPTVMLGYFRDIVDEQIRFSPVSEIRTGDEGYLGPDNEIHLLGRTDHVLNLYGEKLHPSAIELPVNRLPGVRTSLAWLERDEQGRRKVALNVVADQQQVSEEHILHALRDQVPRLFLPQVIKFVDSLVRTEIGNKLVRPKG